jgi:hypothetical protein
MEMWMREFIPYFLIMLWLNLQKMRPNLIIGKERSESDEVWYHGYQGS